MTLLDTHHYDGKLKDRIDSLLPHIIRAASIPKSQKVEAFSVLRNTLIHRPTFNIVAQTNFDQIVMDFIQYDHNPGPNYDPTNNLYADDVLYLCSEIITPDLIDLLNTQLAEISLGPCSQGRAYRLLQIVGAILN